MSELFEFTFYLIHSAHTEKIQVYDETIRECYIGSTRRPDQRFISHKYNCNNTASNRYNLPVYRHIRESGGFDNWQISILETHTITKADAKIHERWLIELYESALNTHIPSRTRTEYYAETREYQLEKQRAYNASHKEEYNAYQRSYQASHREEINAKQRDRYYAKKAALSL